MIIERDGTASSRWTPVVIQPGPAGETRTRVATAPVDNPGARFFLRFEGDLAADGNHRAGVTIINTGAT